MGSSHFYKNLLSIGILLTTTVLVYVEENVSWGAGINHKGALNLPCDTVVFEHLMWMLEKDDGATRNMSLEQLINFYRHETDCGSEAKVSNSSALDNFWTDSTG
ncbi:hypothetical protein SUGI_0365400 [Cryptomeria japonica]|nr:hypothetical protein SUGI_0365400 [Cryptomeria japonica]